MIQRLRSMQVSDWIELGLLLVALIGMWYRFDNRLTNLENLVEQNRTDTKQLAVVMDKLNLTLDKLSEQLTDFPLHRHLSDGIIVYPGGTTLSEQDLSLSKRRLK